MYSADKSYTIQVLRAFAAISVLMFHGLKFIKMTFSDSTQMLNSSILTIYSNLSKYGYIGFDVFFIISGFIMVFLYQKKSENIFIFYKKRFIRIYPIYFEVLAIALIFLSFDVTWIFDRIHHISSSKEIDFISSLFLLPIDENMRYLLDVSWTLSHEILFYTIFGLLLWKADKKLIFGIVTFGILIIFNSVFYHNNSWLNFILNKLNIEFCIGALLAFLIYSSNIFYKKLSLIFLSLFLIYVYKYFDAKPSKIAVILSIVIIPSLLFLEKQRKILYPKLLILIGDSSYSIYLMHFLAFEICHILYPISTNYTPLNLILCITLYTALPISVGIANFHFCEKKIIFYLRNRFIKESSY